MRLCERIAYLERMLYGSRRARRRQTLNEGPTLFDDEFKEALDEKHAAIEQTAREISAEAVRRREVSRKPVSRPSKYQYAGLKEEVRVVYPEGIDVKEYDVIGKDVTRILHRTPAQVWVEVIERPYCGARTRKMQPVRKFARLRPPRPLSDATMSERTSSHR